MIKKISIGTMLLCMAISMAGTAQAEFVIGGANGWSFSTDGWVNVFGEYQTSSPHPAGHDNSFLGNEESYFQKFGVRVGLVPQIVAFNIKAPIVNGIESKVRVGFYPEVQNSSDNRFDTHPGIDNREFFYTASGKYGELLAGRALNLFQGQNILNDMTIFSAGVLGLTASAKGGAGLGHIGYGYLYTNFGPQFRYTTPDMNGVKVALEIGEPYAISKDSAKQAIPRIEMEVSYANVFKNGTFHAWLAGLWQSDTRSKAAGVARPGGHNISLGIAPGLKASIGSLGLNLSGYYGRGLGMISVQDGGLFGTVDGSAVQDSTGSERKHWGFLAQTNYKLSDSWSVGANYGSSNQVANPNENGFVKKKQEAAVTQINYFLNKFTQFTFEYIWARDTYMDGQKQHSNQFALGTIYYW